MKNKNTVLIVPPNDQEAVMIVKLAEKLGLPMIQSRQHHGASLDKGKDVVPMLKKSDYQKVVIVEMPGLQTEQEIKDLGMEVVIIDHHHYTDLDRATDPKTGKMLPSSLEQFLKYFKINNAKLKKWGFDPKLVRGVGIMDRGFVWALEREGYNSSEVKKMIRYWRSLTPHINPRTEERKENAARRAWERRKKWDKFFVVTTSVNIQLRPRLSLFIAEEIGKPTPLILIEHGRGLVYVQESEYAEALFEAFGGFTFGVDRNWGFRNIPGEKKVTLRDIKKVIERAKMLKKHEE